MVEHDGQVGQLLEKLDDLGIANNTIVIYTTDNGAKTLLGRMAAPPRSAARRTRTGRAVTECRRSFAGLG
jgi:arylsulfatase A-like enzyme